MPSLADCRQTPIQQNPTADTSAQLAEYAKSLPEVVVDVPDAPSSALSITLVSKEDGKYWIIDKRIVPGEIIAKHLAKIKRTQ